MRTLLVTGGGAVVGVGGAIRGGDAYCGGANSTSASLPKGAMATIAHLPVCFLHTTPCLPALLYTGQLIQVRCPALLLCVASYLFD